MEEYTIKPWAHNPITRHYEYLPDGVSATLELTQNQWTLVDAEDIPDLIQWAWYAHWAPNIRGYYAIRNEPRGNGKQKVVRMSRYLTNAKRDFVVDHISHNTLDNRKDNLRVCLNSENGQNRAGMQSNNTSLYKGVSYHKHTGKWQGKIRVNKSDKHLGLFDSPQDAALAHDEAVRKYHGVYGTSNSDLGRISA